MKFPTRLKEEKSRVFRTFYFGRYRVVKKTVWYFSDGGEKHQLVLTDSVGAFVYKKWTWVTSSEGEVALFKGHRKPITTLASRRIEKLLNEQFKELE